MTPRKLRLLAECLDLNFITVEDRHGWATDLRGMAKSMERERADYRESIDRRVPQEEPKR